MFDDKLLLPRPARQFESVCGCETPDGKPGQYACWVEQDKAWLARLVSTPQTLGFDPADGRGEPSVQLSAEGITAQMGMDVVGEFGAYLDVDGYLTLARPGRPLQHVRDTEESRDARIQRRALFVLRDQRLPNPVGVYQAPRDGGGLDLHLVDADGSRCVYSQSAPPAGTPQGLTATTPRPLTGAAKSSGLGVNDGAPYRRWFIFGGPDARGNLQAWALDVATARTWQLTQSDDAIMAGIAYWRAGQRCFACVGIEEQGVPTGIRTYVEPADGETPWQRAEDYRPPAEQLATYADPGAAQSPEISAPLTSGEQLVAWSVHDRAHALTSFACGMPGAICAAILGRPESARVLTVLDHPVCEPELIVGDDGNTWWIIYERGAKCVDQWDEWDSELRVIGPLTVADFE